MVRNIVISVGIDVLSIQTYKKIINIYLAKLCRCTSNWGPNTVDLRCWNIGDVTGMIYHSGIQFDTSEMEYNESEKIVYKNNIL